MMYGIDNILQMNNPHIQPEWWNIPQNIVLIFKSL